MREIHSCVNVLGVFSLHIFLFYYYMIREDYHVLLRKQIQFFEANEEVRKRGLRLEGISETRLFSLITDILSFYRKVGRQHKAETNRL